MKTTKFVILALIMSILSLSTIGAVAAPSPPSDFYGYITDYANAASMDNGNYVVHVGDTFTITVSAENDGFGDWENVYLSAPLPKGLQYISHVMPDITNQNYNPSTGIWEIDQMKWTGRGHHKSMIVTVKALPEAAGETLSFKSRFTSLIFVDGSNYNRTDMVANGWAPYGSTINIKVLSKTPDGNRTENRTENRTDPGIGPGIGPGNGNGDKNLVTALGNNQLQAGGGGGKAYEVTKAQNSSSMYLLALLLIVAMIVVGYFYGIRKER